MRTGRSAGGCSMDWPSVRLSCRRFENCSWKVATASGVFYMRCPRYLQFRMQGVAHELVHRFIGQGRAIGLVQPSPNRLITGKAVGLAQTVPEGLLHGRRQERHFAWALAIVSIWGRPPLTY